MSQLLTRHLCLSHPATAQDLHLLPTLTRIGTHTHVTILGAAMATRVHLDAPIATAHETRLPLVVLFGRRSHPVRLITLEHLLDQSTMALGLDDDTA